MAKVMIDPGHGPGNANGGKNGYREYNGMWKLSNYLKSALIRCGINADLTRTEFEDPNLEVRGRKALGYDLFISEHSNAGGGKGVECYYSVNRPWDNEYAAIFAADVSKAMDSTNRGGKIRSGEDGSDYYGVMRSAAATSAKHVFLIENGFHDNLQDEAFLLKDENLKCIAEVQARMICKILNKAYVTADITHFAEESWNSLNKNGVTVYEKRFDDYITRGEVFVLFAKIAERLCK